MNGHTVLACCDRELIGRVLEQGELTVEIRASFYKQDEIDAGLLKELIAQADSANLFGKRSVAVAVKEGFIKQSNIIMIGGVPHAQIYKM